MRNIQYKLMANIADDNFDPNEPVKTKYNSIGDTNNRNDKRSCNKILKSLFTICLLLSIIGVTIPLLKVKSKTKVDIVIKTNSKLKYWVYSNNANNRNETGHLKQVHKVLRRLNYELTNDSNWSILWAYKYAFNDLPSMKNLSRHQKVNQFPGSFYITNKVRLATIFSEYIPKAFHLPSRKVEFLKYAKENKNALFLEKNHNHRGVYMKNASKIDDNNGKNFVQEYIQRPFLVDGHKFDIGVYVVITSVNPLRVYWYKGDVLFRYCKAKYLPFNPQIRDKYVIQGARYLPSWEVPSLSHSMNVLGYGMKDAFDIYARAQGKNPLLMWKQVQKAISEVFYAKETYIVDYLNSFESKDNFFELMRFDLLVDEDMRVYVLEANFQPNLCADIIPRNQLLYQQLLYSTFSLVGVNGRSDMNASPSEQVEAQEMVSAEKNIAVWGVQCSVICNGTCSVSFLCALCKPCRSADTISHLLRAHTEHLHRGDFRRLIPSPMKPGMPQTETLKDLNPANKLHYLWYLGKCNTDITWCT